VWLKAVSTLDVLSGGRAWFGIGAAWNVEEARALGIPFPDLPERFRLLDDTLRMAHQVSRGERDAGSFEGRVVRAGRLMLSPQPLSRPRIPILVGGGGERTTLRLVARYADACNVFGAPDMLRHKYDVLRRHCDAVGRDYDAIEKTNLATISITPDGRQGSLTPSRLIERLGGWAAAGSHQAIVSIRGVGDLSKIDLIARDVIPHIGSLGEASPLDRS
jgi:alkanesulfonate monooxygenase SsuD/methylene tetrahydromethanopterin reductase-like flavin-dependent oxidoreductase (luciferase family)